jgi:hypothetical protein
MKDSNYIVIQGWMVNRLKLSGNELMVYAVIHGFSQDGKSGYEGGGQYLCASCGVSRRALTDILNSLVVKKKYLLKEYFFKNNVEYCRYKSNPEFFSKEDKIGQKIEPENENLPAEGMANSAMGYGNNCHGSMANSATGYGNNCHGGMANSANNITTNINLNTATAASEPPDSNTDPPPGDKAAAAVLTPKKIKEALSSLDKRLFFDDEFYSRAAAFVSRHKIDFKYFEWLHEQCGLKKPNSFDGLYFKLFFAENMIEKYKAFIKPPPPEQPPPPAVFKCPVCGAVHSENDEMCPDCSLPRNPTPNTVSLFRELLTFPAGRRDEYLKRENVIYSEFKGDFVKLKVMIASLRKEFNLGEIHETPSRSYRS